MSSILGAPPIGQGEPGGAAALPGSSTLPGVTPLTTPGRLPGVTPLPGTGLRPAPLSAPTTTTPSPSSFVPSFKAHSIANALSILDQVHQGILPWQDAQRALSTGLTGFEREALKAIAAKNYGDQAIDPLRALGDVTPEDTIHPHHSLLTNLGHDISGFVKGTPAGLGLAAAYAGQDVYNAAVHGEAPTKFYNKILKPAGESLAQTYSPLVHGDLPGFYHEFHSHPLGPILDALSIASAGVGAVGRVNAATRAIRAGEVTRDVLPKGATAVVGQRAGINLSVHPLSNGLWQIRDRGKIVASRFPTEDSAIAHAQSLATGGVHADALKQTVRETYIPARGERGTQRIAEGNAFPDLQIHDTQNMPGKELTQLLSETGSWSSGSMKGKEGYLTGPGSVARAAIHWAMSEPDVSLVTARDATGELGGVATVDLAGEVNVDYAAAKTPGAGIALIQHVAKSFPGRDISFMAANDEVGRYYERMGATRHGTSSEFTISAANAAKIARGESLVKGKTYRSTTVGEGLKSKGPARLGLGAAIRGGTQGNLIDAYEKARNITHETEDRQLMDELISVIEDGDVRLQRRTRKEVYQDVIADLRATREAGRKKPAQMAAEQPGFISSGSTGRALGLMGTSLREASDLVRAGAIYLRVGYLPNNWSGNEFMNIVQQGPLAPLELGKALVITKHLDPLNLKVMRQSTGQNAARAIFGDEGERIAGGRARGYVSSLTEPVAHTMGAIADQPFRDAAFIHEARRQGYRTLGSIDRLLSEARGYGTSARGEAALRKVAEIGRRSSEEIVKFRHMNDIERQVLRNLVFVYSWMRGAGRYAGRFPFAHPIQAASFAQLSNIGNDWLKKELGGVPSFLIGAIPVGHDSKGNPLLINPFSLNPLGTGLQLGQAAAGTLDVLQDPKSFNKYAQQDILSLTNPLIQTYINAREGGKDVGNATENTIAGYRLVHELKHPDSGSIYPTSRTEAIGHFLGGSLYPRLGDQAAITRSLERENANNPEALIPSQAAQYKKATGQAIPKELVKAYEADLKAISLQKEFQTAYAKSHGASGFRNLPPQNRAEAALDYLRRFSLIDPKSLQAFEETLTSMTTDSEFNDFANTLWNSTGVGSIKRQWDDLLREAKSSTSLTRKRK